MHAVEVSAIDPRAIGPSMPVLDPRTEARVPRTGECIVKRALLALGNVSLLTLAVAMPVHAQASDALVTVASPTNNHPQNASNEPALAVDATRPNVLAAGANELIDMQPCSQAASTQHG